MDYFKPVDITEIEAVKNINKYGRLRHIIQQFHDSDYEAVEIDWKALGYVTAGKAAASFVSALRRAPYQIKAVRCNNKCFLVKKGE